MDNAKRDEIAQWLIKGHRDLRTAHLLLESGEPLLDIAVYHCQQASEKTLKAYLVYQGAIFPKTHNLNALLEQCLPFNSSFDDLRDVTETLTPYATEFRYPTGVMEPERFELEEALTMAEQLMKFVVALLPEEFQR